MASQPTDETSPLPLAPAYADLIAALTRTNILSTLSSGELGVIGIDGNAYPVPTQQQVQDTFARNEELVNRKMSQGFTELLLTPLAMPTLNLIERVQAAIRQHAAARTIIQTKRHPDETDMPARVNARDPLWTWEVLRKNLDTSKLVYFPQTYTKRDHEGVTKEEAMQDSRWCAVPGWSVGLIEPLSILPQVGQGQVIGGRKQLEGSASPREYIQTLGAAAYAGETGWTPEDFLTYFLTHLELTHQVSHDRSDNNALWLLGAYLPDMVPYAELVPVGYWSREVGHKLYLSTHRTGNRFHHICVARTMVRLGA